MRQLKAKLSLLPIVIFGFPITPASGSSIYAAVASNFSRPAKEIVAAFENHSGDEVKLSFGSTGKHFAHIVNGAPFDIFLSADARRAKRVVEEGYGIKGSRFTYAIGRLALYSADANLIDGADTALTSPSITRIAIANPKTAPYGEAAHTVLQLLGIYDNVKGKIITGENIAQTFQFVATGNVAVGFVALSQIKNLRQGSRWIIPQAYYPPIHQQAVLLQKGSDNPTALKFLEFLRSAQAKEIIENFGYGVE